MVPSDPPAQMVPQINPLLYLRASIGGMASTVSNGRNGNWKKAYAYAENGDGSFFKKIKGKVKVFFDEL